MVEKKGNAEIVSNNVRVGVHAGVCDWVQELKTEVPRPLEIEPPGPLCPPQEQQALPAAELSPGPTTSFKLKY